MRILICEDEPLIRSRLLRLCQEYAQQQARFDAVATTEEAVDRLERTAYDALLLDLNLEGEDGFELLRRCTAGRYQCVVVSAHRERALEAFELGVLDFVAKPFSRERLHAALDRLLQVSSFRTGALRYLGVWRAKAVATVAVDDIQWVRADEALSELCLSNGRRELHEKSLAALAQLLPHDFVRCHRSYLVNLKHIAEFHCASGSRYWLRLRDGSELPVGRSHVANLRAALGQ